MEKFVTETSKGKLVIEMNTDNAAFDDPGEVGRIITKATNRVVQGETYGKLMDINGNTVGSFEIVEDDK